MTEDSHEIKIIDSSIIENTNYYKDKIIINVILPNGMIVTNPQQFIEDEYYCNNCYEDKVSPKMF
jgi:hypothetical protein